jgi:hypothetical protein
MNRRFAVVGLIVTVTIATMMVGSSLLLGFAQSSLSPPYTQVVSASKEQSGGSLKLSVTAAGDIPRFPDSFIHSVLVFGYAWVDTTTGMGIVAAIHPTFVDSHQRPHGWHTHTVTLSAGTSSSTFCIASLGTSEGGLSIHGDDMNLNIAVNQAGMTADSLNVAVSFVVQSDSGCTTTGLGVVVLSTATL